MIEEVFTIQPNSKSNIKVKLIMPDDWNGRFVGLGNGGAAGVIHEKELSPYASKGYAVAMTDMGTGSATTPQQSGIGNPEVWKDFGHRATHLMTLEAKDRIKKHYGKLPKTSIFYGQSTGGQQSLSSAQRYPEDYNAIIAGVPAHCRTPLHAYFLWLYQHTHHKDGTPIFTADEESIYRKAAIDLRAQYENFPRAKGCFISDPRWREGEKEALIEIVSKQLPDCTDEKLSSLRAVQNGPVHEVSGKQIFDGVPPGAKFMMSTSNLYLFNWVFGADIDYMKLNFSGDYDKYHETLSADLDAEDEKLDEFKALGGKLIIYSGTEDHLVPYSATLAYYERVAKHFGSYEKANEFCQFYILPGRAHSGGNGIQELYRLMDGIRLWYEKGALPQQLGISCTGNFRIPVYPYPYTTAHDGTKRLLS